MMRRTTRSTVGALALGLSLATALPLQAQEPGAEPEARDRVGVDFEEVQEEVERALQKLEAVDMERVRADVERALSELDGEEIRQRVEMALEKLDLESIEEEVRLALEEVDGEQVREQLERAREQVERAREQVQTVRRRMTRRPRLGIEIDLDQDARWDSVGVRVRETAPEGPAGEGGIRGGDVIVEIAGRSLTEPLDDAREENELDPDGSLPVQRLMALLEDLEPGETVEVGYLRDGERRDANVELGSFRGPRGLAPPGAQPRSSRFRAPRPPRAPRAPVAVFRLNELCGDLSGPGATLWNPGCVAGLRVEELGPDLGRYFGTERGLLVLEVAEGSPLGLRPGDVVLSIGDRSIDDVEDLRRVLTSYEQEEEVRFRLRRDDRELTVTGFMP